MITLLSLILAMGSTSNETLRSSFPLLSLPQHTKNIRTLPAFKILHIHLRCQRRRSLPFRDDCKNNTARLRQGRKSLLQKPLVRLRQLHGAEYLGVHCSASAGDSRNCSAVFIAVNFESTTTADYDSILESFPQIFNATK